MFSDRVLAVVAPLICALALSAQGSERPRLASSIELPRAFALGPMLEDLPVVVLPQVGPSQPLATTVTDVTQCVLRIDRRATVRAVAPLLVALQARGVSMVHFVAALPDGTEGCFSLSLPAAATVTSTLTMRLHRERTGVPATSVVPLLQRMQRGVTAAPFAVLVDAPAAASFQQVLASFAALQLAGVPASVLHSREGDEPAAAGLNGDGALAVDLGPQPLVPVSARAVPQPRPSLAVAAVGCLTPAPPATGQEFGGRAGGRYAGRAGGRMQEAVANITAGLDWLAKQQQPDGSFCTTDGQPAATETALAMLVVLGNGDTLVGGSHGAMLNRGIGWLLDQQRDDGTFGNAAPWSTRRDALVTYALSEAYGMSRAPLLKGALEEALSSLGNNVRADGGFAAGTRTAVSDAASTALVTGALASADFFKIEQSLVPADVVAWFSAVDQDPKATQEATAAALFCRFLAGMDPRGAPTMHAGADRLTQVAVVDEPWACYWTTCALFQMGGRHWKDWSGKVAGINAQQLTANDGAGSWAPAAGLSAVSTSCLRLLTLQAYLRYARIVR